MTRSCSCGGHGRDQPPRPRLGVAAAPSRRPDHRHRDGAPHLVPWQCWPADRRPPRVHPLEGPARPERLRPAIDEAKSWRCGMSASGTIPPLDVIWRRRAVGLLIVDGAQLSPQPVDVCLGADALVFSAHKMCGPTGIGVGQRNASGWADQYGGDMISTVTATRRRGPRYPNASKPALDHRSDRPGGGDVEDRAAGDRRPRHRLTRYALGTLGDVPGWRSGPVDTNPGRRDQLHDGRHPPTTWPRSSTSTGGGASRPPRQALMEILESRPPHGRLSTCTYHRGRHAGEALRAQRDLQVI